MIRLATVQDRDRLLELFQQFHQASPYSHVPFSVSKTDQLLEHVLKSTEGIVVVAENEGIVIGFLAGLVSELPFAMIRVASELAWWVDPKYRKSKDSLLLLQAYMYWAKNVVKTDQIQVANLMNEYAPALNRLYTKYGFEKKEETWLFQL